MKYTITLFNKFKRPYFYSGKMNNSQCVNIETSTYEVNDIELCKQIINDFLDAPIAEMSLDEVRKQFADPMYGSISEFKLVAIQNYYNGRLALYKTIIKHLEATHKNNISSDTKYNIPYEYNHFVIEDNDDYNEEQLEAYIELKVSYE